MKTTKHANGKDVALEASGESKERRAIGRRRMLKGAVLRFNRGYGALECVVRNYSERGALLSMGDTAAVPRVFDIRIAGEEAIRQAEARWRSPTAVGISFA